MNRSFAFESRLNIHLSGLLSDSGVVSRSEIIGPAGRRRDIVVYHQGLECVLEGSYSKTDAEKDARTRIEQLGADIALAIHYNKEDFPQNLSEDQIKEQLKKVSLSVKIIVPEDISGTLFEILHKRRIIASPVEDWYDLNFDSLVALLRESSQFLMTEETLVQFENEVNGFITAFVQFLSNHHATVSIARNLYSILYRLYGFSIGKPEDIKEAVFAQSVLAILLSSIYYESVRYAHNLKPIKELSSNSQEALFKAFNDILDIDYEPIFEVSKEMLTSFPPSPRFFNRMVDLVSEIVSKKVLLKRDFAGRVYHRVVGEWSLRKGLATYFTQIPPAYLLAYLAQPALSRVCDFACGSGTLLTATYSAANSLYRRSLLKEGVKRDPLEIESSFHREFIRQCYGFDVLSYATQITAINLALHSPETPLEEDDFDIYTLPLGVKEGESGTVSLGSLELARKGWHIWEGSGKIKKTSLSGKSERLMQELREFKPFDFIIMNPPFTRATGRGGREGGGLFGFIPDSDARVAVIRKFESFRDEVRKKLTVDAKTFLRHSPLKFLLRDRDFNSYKSIGQSGEGLLFLYLADIMVKEGGKISFVLPKNILSAPSWFLMRTLLASKYHLETVVVSYDSEGGYNFSESTSLSECLFVARKVTEHSGNDRTKFLVLLKKPGTTVEAIGLANITNSSDSEYIECGRSRAFLITVDRKELNSFIDNWGRFVFLPNLRLLKQVKELLSGVIRIGNRKGNVPLVRLNDLIVSIGIDRHQFSDNFRVVPERVPGSKKIVYGGG